jgi:hypothetical protein
MLCTSLVGDLRILLVVDELYFVVDIGQGDVHHIHRTPAARCDNSAELYVAVPDRGERVDIDLVDGVPGVGP